MPVDYIGIGGQRCGTTWLHQVLKEHPDNEVSTKKESHYFSYNYHYGLEWYENHFRFLNKKKCGEFSTSYLYDKQIPKRVKDYNTDMKIILSIRNPIDRFISHHKHEVQRQRFTRVTKDPFEIIKNNLSYLEFGLYYKALNQWLKYFSKKQLLVILFDDIVKTPERVVSNMYKFLEIDNQFKPICLHEKINPSWIPKSSFLLHSQKMVAKSIRNVGMGKLVDCLINIGLKETINKINTDDSSTIINIDDDFENHIMEYFQDDLQNLSKFVGADLHKIWFE